MLYIPRITSQAMYIHKLHVSQVDSTVEPRYNEDLGTMKITLL